MSHNVDVIIIGAGAAGLMCAIEAGKRGRSVVVMDHANKAGKKILMSGGGRCNFTNLEIDADNFLSHNPHFCKSALSRYTQWDFIALVEQHHIPYCERDHGQLFCRDSSKAILAMLLLEVAQAGAAVMLNTHINAVWQRNDSDESVSFELQTSAGHYRAESLVVAAGGLSIPRMGASPLGYRLAEQFGLKVRPTRAGLVPFTLQPPDRDRLVELAGVATDSCVSNERMSFREHLLFTHRGLSGPAILQLSSYWQPGEAIVCDLSPEISMLEALRQVQQERPKLQLINALANYLPKRMVNTLFADLPLSEAVGSLSRRQLERIAAQVHHWTIRPNGTEGYRTAEVTLGGVDCDALSSKTMQSSAVAGLYFIGEVVDVSGWLGGYNFQWAWSSGWCAGQYA